MHCEAGGYRNVWQLWSTSEILNVVISGCKDNGHAVVNADDLNSFLPLQGHVDPTELSTLVSGDKVSQQKKAGHFFVRAVFATSSSPTVHVLAMTTKRSCFMSMPWKETPKISSLSSFFIEASHHFSLSSFSACNCWPDLSPLPELQAGRQAKNAFTYNLLQNRFSSCSMIQVESYFVRFIRAVVLGIIRLRHHSCHSGRVFPRTWTGKDCSSQLRCVGLP